MSFFSLINPKQDLGVCFFVLPVVFVSSSIYPKPASIIHCTQELISALDLHTVPWSQVPRHLKQRLALPLLDRGIDSLALNLTVAVQAKDYSNSVVPLNRFLGYAQVGSFSVD